MSRSVFGEDGALAAALRRLAAELERGVDPSPPLSRLASRPPISVVIPVYDGADSLRRCVASIRRAHEAEDEPELILVDDHSGVEAAQACHELARAWPRTRVLRNDRNLGFVASVNRGMKAATPHHDVLLLNSDTVVSKGWLRGLGVTAHLDDSIGTVCPLSNAAGVFSIPAAYEDGPLPEGFDVDMCQRVLELVAPRLDERVPTTSGFCMLIKRAVLEEIGFFDEKLFLRGYGEENDFNERASAAGFRHVVDDGRFVAHERGASFGGGKRRLKEQNSRVLKVLWPDHVPRTKAWLETSRLDETRRPYGALIEDLANATEGDRARFFDAPASVTVRFSSQPGAGIWSADERRVVVREQGDETWAIDLFGLVHARIRERTAGAVAFALGRRFSVPRLEARGLGAPVSGQLDEVETALGVPPPA